MILKYGVREYTTKPIDINLKDKAYYFLFQFRKLIIEFTSDIDTEKLDGFNEAIKEKELIISQSEEWLPQIPETDTEEKEKTLKRIEDTKNILVEIDNEMKSDKEIIKTQRLLKEAESYALLSMISKRELVMNMLGLIINEPTADIDLTTNEGQLFSVQAITFFLNVL